MAAVLLFCTAIALIALLLVGRYLAYQKQYAASDGIEETVQGMVLSTPVSPLGTMAGTKMCSVELLLDSGEKRTLTVSTLSLLHTLTPGTKCSFQCTAAKLISFQPEQ